MAFQGETNESKWIKLCTMLADDMLWSNKIQLSFRIVHHVKIVSVFMTSLLFKMKS